MAYIDIGRVQIAACGGGACGQDGDTVLTGLGHAAQCLRTRGGNDGSVVGVVYGELEVVVYRAAVAVVRCNANEVHLGFNRNRVAFLIQLV